MSFSTLNIGVSALTASSRAVELAAHNVANSTVEGYTRQRLELTAARPGDGPAGQRGGGMRGTGVEIVSISRLRSSLSDIAYRGEASTAGEADARAQVLERAQGVIGPYGAGLPDSLNKLWASFDQLAVSPEQPAARQIVLDAGATVATGLKDAAFELNRIRQDATAQLSSEVDEVNGLGTTVADLNRRIADAITSGQQPNDLLDKRDLALDKLSNLAGATSRIRPNGMVDVSLGGAQLVRGVSATALVLGSTPPPAGMQGADPTYDLDGTTPQIGGSLAGRTTVLVTDLRDFESRLDSISADIAGRVNAQHMAGFDQTGAAGGAFFTGTKARDMALAPGLTLTTIAASGPQPGPGPFAVRNGENALQLARLRDSATTGVTLNDSMNALASTLGSRSAGATRSAGSADAGLDAVREQRTTEHGVSVNEEMAELVKFQHSYDAAARVIAIADGMLDTLINGMGVGR